MSVRAATKRGEEGLKMLIDYHTHHDRCGHAVGKLDGIHPAGD